LSDDYSIDRFTFREGDSIHPGKTPKTANDVYSRNGRISSFRVIPEDKEEKMNQTLSKTDGGG